MENSDWFRLYVTIWTKITKIKSVKWRSPIIFGYVLFFWIAPLSFSQNPTQRNNPRLKPSLVGRRRRRRLLATEAAASHREATPIHTPLSLSVSPKGKKKPSNPPPVPSRFLLPPWPTPPNSFRPRRNPPTRPKRGCKRKKLTPGSLMKALVQSGAGDANPSDGDQLIFHCTTRTIEGAVVNSTRYEYGGKGKHLRLVLGKSKMILGFAEGFPTMLKGEIIAMISIQHCLKIETLEAQIALNDTKLR